MEWPRNHHRGNSVLENQLFLIVRFQHHGVFVEALDLSGKLDAAHQVYGQERFVFTSVVQKRFLNILRLLFHRGYLPSTRTGGAQPLASLGRKTLGI